MNKDSSDPMIRWTSSKGRNLAFGVKLLVVHEEYSRRQNVVGAGRRDPMTPSLGEVDPNRRGNCMIKALHY